MCNWAYSVLRKVLIDAPRGGSPVFASRASRAWRVLHVSENTNNGVNAGAFTFNGNNDSSNRNRNIGARLAVGFVHLTALLQGWGEYVDPIQFGSVSEELGD